MSQDKERRILVRAMAELNNAIEKSLEQEIGIPGKARKLNTFNTPLLRSILFGVLGFGLGVSFSANLLILSSSFSILFSTLGVVLSLYFSKGGNSVLNYDIALQELDEELDRQKNEINKLVIMNAPEELVSNRWDSLEILEKRRTAIVFEKSQVYFKNKDYRVKNERNQLKLEEPKEEILELRKEVVQLKEELEIWKETSRE